MVKGPNSLFISCSEDTKIGISNGQLIDYHNTSLRALFYDEFNQILVSGGGKESLSFHKYCSKSDAFHLISDKRNGFDRSKVIHVSKRYTIPEFAYSFNPQDILFDHGSHPGLVNTNQQLYFYLRRVRLYNHLIAKQLQSSNIETDKRKKTHSKGKKRPFQLQADSRIMSITRLPLDDNHMGRQFYLVLVSDGSCKLISSDYETIHQCEVTKKNCPTKIILLDDNNVAIIDTGGYLNIFKFSLESNMENKCSLERIKSIRVETGGLNAILWSNGYFFVGGDSGIVHRVKWDGNHLTVMSGAPISTCGIVQILDGDKDCIFTLAIDQRILKISKDDLRYIGGRVTHVADPSDFVLDENTKSFIVVGDGIERISEF